MRCTHLHIGAIVVTCKSFNILLGCAIQRLVLLIAVVHSVGSICDRNLVLLALIIFASFAHEHHRLYVV